MKTKQIFCILMLLSALMLAACGAKSEGTPPQPDPPVKQTIEQSAEETAAEKGTLPQEEEPSSKEAAAEEDAPSAPGEVPQEEAPLPEETAAEEDAPSVPAEVPQEEAPLPEEEPIDPNTAVLPNLADFLLHSKDFSKGYSDGGRRYTAGPIPDAAREDVVAEILALLEEPRYQLSLDNTYISYQSDNSGETHEYYYSYTGTNPDIFYVDHEREDVSFHVMLKVYDYSYKDGTFDIGLFFCKNFEEEICGKYTVRRTWKDSDGGLRGPDEYPQNHTGSSGGVPDTSGTYDHTPPASKLQCLSCNGDGDCGTCGGSGYTRIGGAKAGCTTCRGNGKCRTCGGSGTR